MSILTQKPYPAGILYPALLLFFLSTLALFINAFIYHYPGNNYFPPNVFYLAINLILIYTGLVIYYGQTHHLTRLLQEVIIFFLVMSLIGLATNATQYTPFQPIDDQIITLQEKLHINMIAILEWSHTHQWLSKILVYAYNSLPMQMAFLPIILMIARRYDRVHEYYYLLIVSTVIGFSIYYLFPTLAPASFIDSPYFMPEQKDTGFKFLQIHQHLAPSTANGGLIALPSFHVIWAWYCLYLLRDWPIFYFTLLPINTLLIASCVLLGWHYPIDVAASAIVIMVTHWLLRYSTQTMTSRLT